MPDLVATNLSTKDHHHPTGTGDQGYSWGWGVGRGTREGGGYPCGVEQRGVRYLVQMIAREWRFSIQENNQPGKEIPLPTWGNLLGPHIFRIDILEICMDSVGGFAWPLLVGGVNCLANSVNKQYPCLLNSASNCLVPLASAS